MNIFLLAVIEIAACLAPHRKSAEVEAENEESACPPRWAHGFHEPGPNRINREFINDLVLFDDGNGSALYVGGGFEGMWDTHAQAIAIWKDEIWYDFSPRFGYYDPFIGDVPYIRSMTVHDDGSGPALYAAGCFATIGKLSAERIAKWDGRTWSALGLGIGEGQPCGVLRGNHYSSVSTLAEFKTGSRRILVAGGNFSTAGGNAANNIVQWDGKTWSPLGDGADGNVLAITSFDDGSGMALFVGGEFQTAGGAPASAVAKWDGSTWSALSSGLVGSVRDFTVFDDGLGLALYAAVTNPYDAGVAGGYVAKWDGVSWSMIGAAFSGGESVLAIQVYDDGKGAALYVSGSFTRAADMELKGIARWDGQAWTPVGGGVDPLPYHFNSIQTMNAFDLGDGPRLVVGGDFDSIGGVPAKGLAQWDGAIWAPLPGPASGGLDGIVLDLKSGDDGTGPALFAGGEFTHGSGQALNNIGKWDGDSWSPLERGMNGRVNETAFFDDGTGSALFAVGLFSEADGKPANRVAKWNGNTWAPLGDGLGVNGDFVLAVAGVQSGPAFGLYAAGEFEVPEDHIARWNGKTWEAVGYGLSHRVLTLASFDDGNGPALNAGGRFRRAGGIAVNRVAKWNGVSWSPVGSGFPNTVFKLVALDDGTGSALYACWDIGISKWDGSAWTLIGSADSSGIFDAAIFDDGGGSALFVAGYFNSINGIPVTNMAKWDGLLWQPIDPRPYSSIRSGAHALEVYNDGHGPALYVGGEVWRAGDTISHHIAKWYVPRRELPGDFECDADVDLTDFTQLALCLGGPNAAIEQPFCRSADIDADADVDLADYATIQQAQTVGTADG